MTSLPSVVLDVWSHVAKSASRVVVLPDGCRDLILRIPPGSPPQWFVSSLDDTAYSVERRAGEFFAGYRLRPGAVIDETVLLALVGDRNDPDVTRTLSLLDDCVSLDARIVEALDSLSNASSVADATRQLGVSERSLERLVMMNTERTPSYWKNLARVRRAARALPGLEPLAAIAADHGYTDQAHLSRDFQRWFGTSPSLFRRSPDLHATVADSGFC